MVSRCSLIAHHIQQVAKYDDGVGTSSFVPLAILGGAFGFGLKRNILDLYKFVCRNYAANEKVFLFGFSRGAFTVRVLTGLILQQGLVQADSEAELHDLARKAYRAYRANGYHSYSRIEVPFRKLRDSFVWMWDRLTGRKSYDQAKNVVVPTIEFVGVWDTVAAYGLPVDEMTRGVSNWIWPLELPNRILSPRVNFARHALALDDERTTFHPVLWTEDLPAVTKQGDDTPIEDQQLVQMWFAGMHANVGGGYPDDAMAFVPLFWMMNEAKRRGLIFKSEPFADPDTFKLVRSTQDKDGRLYDSRAGLGGYYRYGPRSVFDLTHDPDNDVLVNLPKIHDSVFGRIDSGCNAYAPISLPQNYALVTGNGRVLPPVQNPYETPAEAAARALVQERIWNYVWLRRLVYFLTMAATFHLAAFWLFHGRNAAHEFGSSVRLVSEFVRLVGSLLPDSLHWWTDWYAGNPEWFAGGVIIAAILTAVGLQLSGTISDLMRINWNSKGATDPVPVSRFQRSISALRANRFYRWIIRAGRRQVLPLFSVLFLAWVVLTSASHFLFNIADSAGAYCSGTDDKKTVKVDKGVVDQDALNSFDTGQVCAPTGLTVKRGYTYEITIVITSDWYDKDIKTDPVGYYIASRPWLSRIPLYLGFPLRRLMFRPYFRLVARVGEKGVDEFFLDPVNVRKDDKPTDLYKARFTADRAGEIFLYVNDAVVGFPWINSVF